MNRLPQQWALLAGVIALAFGLVTPPFQVPDEVGHYWRSYTIARGALLPTVSGGWPGSWVPRGARDLVAALWVPTAGRPELKVGAARLRAAAQLRLQQEELVWVRFPAWYTPVPHAATVLGCWIGDKLAMPPLYSFYLGRFLNAAAFILLVGAALRRLGPQAMPIAAVGLLPMTLYLAGSYSPDAVTIGLAEYVTALVLTPPLAPDEETRYWIVLPSTALLLALCKPVYFLLPLLVIAVPRAAGRKSALRYATLVGVIALGLAFSTLNARRNYFPMRTDVATSPTAQVSAVENHPVRFLGIALQDYAQHSLQYADHFVGHLGWLDIPLPKPLVALVFCLLLCVALTTGATIVRSQRIAGAIILLASCLLISLSQYLVWTPIGANAIEGMQGRYFLPLAPLALTIIGLPDPWARLKRWMPALYLASALLLDLIGVIFVARRYY